MHRNTRKFAIFMNIYLFTLKFDTFYSCKDGKLYELCANIYVEKLSSYFQQKFNRTRTISFIITFSQSMYTENYS